jgi:AraC-like DNA-binding protein
MWVHLKRRGFTVDQTAYINGFAHTSSFSSAFRRRYGYRPAVLQWPGGHPPRSRSAESLF